MGEPMSQPTSVTPSPTASGAVNPVAVALAKIAVTRSYGRRPVILIDGRTGAGKTTLARHLTASLTDCLNRPVQLVSLDDCYPGWDGLAAGAAAVATTILRPGCPGYDRYDWAAGRLAGWVSLDPAAPTVVEGTGAITQDSARLATLTIWVEAADEDRRAWLAAREGTGYTAWWERWTRQELVHLAVDQPERLADVIVDLHRATILHRVVPDR